ncbi:MAG: quinoprotein dehydrogenase-associated SoxYZ-like carrier [Hansschlegelia sp.]
MTINRARSLALAAAVGALAMTGGARAADDDAARQERWTDLRQSVFGDKKVEAGDLVSIDAPKRAEDASLVPITLRVSKPGDVTSTTLIIDDNPSPVATKVVFGPAGDPAVMKFRVRVDTYTNVHAVAETKDGGLIENAVFLKASGGCSAPAGSSEQDAMAGMGEMRLKVRDDVTPGKTAQATLMIRHPNFNGMQMDQIKRTYTPARYIKEIKVTYNGKDVFGLTSDISLSTNPVIEFGFKPDAPQGEIKVSATDTADGHWEKTFQVPNQSN